MELNAMHLHHCVECNAEIVCVCPDRREGKRRTAAPVKCVPCIKQEEDSLKESLCDA
jgi:hypothetical protein